MHEPHTKKKKSLYKFKRTEIISSVISDPSIMKLGNQTERKIQKNKYMETKQHDTKNQWVHNEIKEEIRYK